MRRLLFIFILTNSVIWAVEIPVGSPISDPLFSVSRELYGRGFLDRFEYAAIGNVSKDGQNAFEKNLLGQFAALSNEYNLPYESPKIQASLSIIESNRQQVSNSNYIKLFPQINIDFSQKLSANILYRVDGELTRDPRFDGKAWRGIAGFAENATINYKTDDFTAKFGISRISWGFAHYGNLMFSRQAMPMTMLAFSYRRWIFDFETATGFLSPLKNQLDSASIDTSFFTSEQRYLSTHSLTIRPFNDLSFSIREVVLYGGPGRRLEPVYLFPFIWYHGQQLNSRLNDNIMGSVGADWRLKGRLWLYGEMLIDDIQIERKTRGDYEPNEMAYLAGTELYDLPIKGTTIALEYERVGNWTFNQRRATNRYLNSNYPIGFPEGPDVDVFNWRLSWWAGANIRLSYLGLYRRHGVGRIDTPWTQPWLSVDQYSEPFPTGIVERQATHGLEITAFKKNWLWGNFGVNYTDIVNVANSPGQTRQNWELSFDIGAKIPPLIWGF
jgi:hypothetical protein